MCRMSRRLLQPSLAESWASAGLVAKDAGVRIVKLAKTSDTHLRVLEERLAAAEAQRSTLWSRLQSAANESDHEATAEAYRRNTSELLQMYREHKIKADSMLFTVLALFGGSIFTLAGSLFGHYRSQQQADELGAKLEHRLKEGLGRAMDLSVDAALEKRVTSAVEAAISRVETTRLMDTPTNARTNGTGASYRAAETAAPTIVPEAPRYAPSSVGDFWWMPLPPHRLVELLWQGHGSTRAPESEVQRARSEAATWAAAAVYVGYLASRK